MSASSLCIVGLAESTTIASPFSCSLLEAPAAPFTFGSRGLAQGYSFYHAFITMCDSVTANEAPVCGKRVQGRQNTLQERRRMRAELKKQKRAMKRDLKTRQLASSILE